MTEQNQQNEQNQNTEQETEDRTPAVYIGVSEETLQYLHNWLFDKIEEFENEYEQIEAIYQKVAETVPDEPAKQLKIACLMNNRTGRAYGATDVMNNVKQATGGVVNFDNDGNPTVFGESLNS